VLKSGSMRAEKATATGGMNLQVRHAFLSIILSTTLLLSSCNFFGNSTLTSITITPETPSVAVGATQQMVATGTYSDGSTSNISSSVTWTSSDVETATVGSTGLVTGVAAGTASITAASGSISGTTTVSVTYANLKSIEVTPTTASITSGESQQFVATATLDDGSTVAITDAVTWTSSNTSVATISSSGLATGQSLASSSGTSITATSGSITSNSATLTVNP
jgi:trimeric autotransporter adhesin